MGWAADTDAVAHVVVDALTDELEVGGDDGHHLQRVRRLRAGEVVTAADGAGAWREYEITATTRGHLRATARGPVELEPQPVPRIGVAVALAKGGLDATVAKLTELGVTRVEPLVTARSVVRWDHDKAHAAAVRLRVVAREAAAQCRRARLPEIGELVSVADLAGRDGVVVADRAGVTAGELASPAAGAWTVVVGPEGGLDHEESQILNGPRLGLGPYVLRSETAPIAAAAALIGCVRWSNPR